MWIKHPGGIYETNGGSYSSYYPYTRENQVWLGTGADNRLYAYRCKLASQPARYIISEYIRPCFKVAGEEGVIEPSPYLGMINGRDAFSGYPNLFWNFNDGWVLGSTAYPYEVFNSEKGEDDGEWEGDEYWVAPALPEGDGQSVVFEGRGTARGTSKTVQFYLPRWEAPTTSTTNIFGKYTAAGGAEGTKVIGRPQFEDQNRKLYVRSVETINYGGGIRHFTYGDIYWNYREEKWVIGTYGAAEGWWEGEEPDDSGQVRFEFTVEDEETFPEEDWEDDLIIVFDKYIEGQETRQYYLGDFTICLYP